MKKKKRKKTILERFCGILLLSNIIQATDLGLAWVWWAYAPVDGDDWI